LLSLQHRFPWLEDNPLSQAGKVVRVIGMVQDCFDVSYYYTPSEQLSERMPYLLVPMPFTTPWFRSLLHSDQHQRKKRVRLDENEAAMNEQEELWPSTAMQSDPEKLPVLANLYYEQYGDKAKDQLKLNDIVEIVGVVECADSNFTLEERASWESAEDEMGYPTNDVPSTVPRLHVLWYKSTDIDSLAATETAILPISPPSVSELACALAISEPAAGALWLSLLSMAEREPMNDCWTPIVTPHDDTTLGCASLNMILPNPEACSHFQTLLVDVLSHILPQVHSINLTAQMLKELLLPRKNRGRLLPTPLQLSKGSTLILNASALESLPKDQTLQALQELCSAHKIQYTFDGGFQIPFEADIRIIVLSVSKCADLACTLQVRCNPGVPIAEDLTRLEQVRSFLSVCRRHGVEEMHNNIGFEPSVMVKAQEDFIKARVEAREEQRPAPGERDFHRWLTLTRLFARSRKSKTAELEDWEQALLLDKAMGASLAE
jgi:hypothetical protein